MGAPDSLDRTDADPGRFSHGRPRPMSSPGRRPGQRQGDHALGDLSAQRRYSRRPRLVAPQPVDTFIGKPLLPAPDDRLGFARLPFDLRRAVTSRRQEHDLCAPYVLLRAVAVGHHRLQLGAVCGSKFDLRSLMHSPDSHDRGRRGILKRIEMSDLVN